MMTIPNLIRRGFDELEPFADEVGKRASDFLAPFARSEGYVFDSRLKTLDSVSEKIESGRFQSWADMDDLYACTLAVPLLRDQSAIISALRERFEVEGVKGRKQTKKAPDRFMYDATRVRARLRPPAGIDTSGDKLFQVLFEVQIMSLYEYAWSRTTHALTYKSNLVAWKRYRLTAHLKAAAEQADFLLLGFETAAELVDESPWPDIQDKASIRETFVEFAKEGLVPPEAMPKDWSRFADNVYRVLQISGGLRPTGFGDRSLPDLQARLDTIRTQLRRQQDESPPQSISLFQNVLGILASAGLIPQDSTKHKYYPPVTPELKDVFPGLAIPVRAFDAG